MKAVLRLKEKSLKIIQLKERPDCSTDLKLNRTYEQFGAFLNELKRKELSQNIITSINERVEEINSSLLLGNELRKFVKQKQTILLKQIEKELKVVPKNYYRNLWLALGMSAFGLPLGLALGLSTGNMGLLAMGLPIGMGIGIGVGSGMDKKAFNEGRQLNLEIKTEHSFLNDQLFAPLKSY